MRKERITPILSTNFALKRTDNPENPYAVRRFPRLGALRRVRHDGRKAEPNIKIPRQEMEQTQQMFREDAQRVGLSVGGPDDPTVRILRVIGVGIGPSSEDPQMHPAEALMKINDGKGNVLEFRLVNQPDFVDGEGRKWDARVVAFMQKAKINGEQVHLSYEMTHNGFVFFTKGMKDMLDQARNGQQPTMTTRQETPDAICFVDGHHTLIGRHDLGCYCKEEREASLARIHERGGINSLVPGAGNGNGTEAQEKQNAVRYSAARRGVETMISYPEIYNRMGKTGDNRNTTLKISTVLMEHLFQTKHIPNITTLTESRTKQNVWHEFGGVHTVSGESLNVTPPDHPDSQYKQSVYGYTKADRVGFPLQPIE